MNSASFWIAGSFTLLTTFVSLSGIYQHLCNYRKPEIQRSIIRILLMPFVYGATSWISFGVPPASLYLDPIRDCYEAFVLWVFFQLMIQYLGGERSLLVALDDGRLPTAHPFPFNFFFSPVDFANPWNFVMLKRGVLQFAIVKPFHALLVIILRLSNVYEEGEIGSANGYIYVSLIYNISVMLSMYCLVLFYVTAHVDLLPHKPLAKFLCIKAVIFFSFWQSLLISLMVKLNVIADGGSAARIQNWIICFEMLIAAFAHRYAFGHQDFSQLSSGRLSLPYALRDASGVLDLAMEARHTVQGTNFLSYNDLLEHSSRRPLLGDEKQSVYVTTSPNLSFPDVHESDEDEELYRDAMRLEGGDYNYHVK